MLGTWNQMRINEQGIEKIAVFIIAVILILVLIIRPVIGVADNGDFARVMGATGLEYTTVNWEDRYFGYVNRQYRIVGSGSCFQGYFSSQAIIVRIALYLNMLLYRNDIFDIRFLSLTYSVIFLISVYLIIKYNKSVNRLTNWIIVLCLVFIFCDIGYISYFNSLYGEPASFCFMFLMVAVACVLLKQGEPKLWLLILFFAVSILFTGAKAQNAPIGILAALFGFRLRKLREDWKWKVVTVIAQVFLLIVPIFIYVSTPEEIKNCNKYNTVFYGVLKDSPSPSSDLKELGLDKRFAVLSGTDYFDEAHPMDIKAPGLKEELYNRIQPWKIVGFYIRHPLRYLEKLQRTAESAFILRQGYGNYEKAHGIEYGDSAGTLTLWSNFKKEFLPNTLAFVALFFAAYFAALILMRTREAGKGNARAKAYVEFLMLIGFVGLVQFLVPIIGDGEADLGRHLFLFNLCFDIIFTVGLVWLTDKIMQIKIKIM